MRGSRAGAAPSHEVVVPVLVSRWTAPRRPRTHSRRAPGFRRQRQPESLPCSPLHDPAPYGVRSEGVGGAGNAVRPARRPAVVAPSSLQPDGATTPLLALVQV